MRHDKQFMCMLAAMMMPAASGNITNALNLAEAMTKEAERRWPDPEREDFVRVHHAAPAAQTEAKGDEHVRG